MTDPPLRIAIADDEPEVLEDYAESLERLGHEVVAQARTGRELIQCCRDAQPDLVITDIKMPDMDGIDAASEICRERTIPVILVSGYHESTLIERAAADHVMAYLIKPVKEADLQTAIALAVRRFKEFQALQQQTDDLRQALEDRKVIERAKGILMKRAGLDEQAAFRRLQKESSSQNKKLVDIAQRIVDVDEAMH